MWLDPADTPCSEWSWHETHFSSPMDGDQMNQEEQLLAAWKRAEPLGFAWLAFADKENTERYRKARRERSHSAIQISLEIDLIARLEDGELQAIGIEAGSNPRPVFIPQYYFSKTAEINWDEETVADFGKKFHQVRIEGPREVVDEPRTEPTVVDPRLIDREWEKAAEALQSEPEPSSEPLVQQGEVELAGDAPPSRPALLGMPLIQVGPEPVDETLPSEPAPSNKPRMGRPPLVPKIRDVVREPD